MGIKDHRMNIKIMLRDTKNQLMESRNPQMGTRHQTMIPTMISSHSFIIRYADVGFCVGLIMSC